MNEPIINVPEIQNVIREKHQKFLDELGPQAEKVAADQKLKADVIMARIFRITVCFKEEDIVDSVKIVEQVPLNVVCLQKTGYDNYINVVTNGDIILLKGYGRSISDFQSDVEMPVRRFRNVQDENYDWLKFADELLDYIHIVIYERKEAAESKIENMFTDRGRH